MKKMSLVSRLVLLAVLVLVCILPFFLRGGACLAGGLKGTVWALVPPIIAIVLALATKEVYSSLFAGVLVGALFVTKYKPLDTVDTIMNVGLISAVKDTAGVFIFLVILGILVALINKTGAAATFGKWAQAHVKTRVGALLATFVLGLLIFVDDYFNCLTVGSVMRPVTDAKKISRAKLAYIIDATAAPVCMIAPISSWAAAVSSYAEGSQYSGIELFVRAIPFNFYSLLTFVFILVITLMKIDFGPMAVHEKNAMEKGDLFTFGGEIGDESKALPDAKGGVIDLIVPVLFLIVICVLGLVYVGGILKPDVGFITAFGDTDATVGLPLGGIVMLVITVIYLLLRSSINFDEAMKAVPEGLIAMVPAITILTLAVSLKNMTGALEGKEYIAKVMQSSAAGLGNYLPAVIFIVACVLAFATGTSWGTFGILIPIVTAIFPGTSPLLIIGMSACLAGAVCGDHCSPISDTTIMSSAGARCEHINHVSTQLPYAITVAVFSFLGFLLSGILAGIKNSAGQNVMSLTVVWAIVFPIMTVLIIASGLVMKARNK